MGTLILTCTFVTSVAAAFFLGTLWTQLRYTKHVESNECPFKKACMVYDPVQTHDAIKRVLNLLIDNDVPKKEIRDIIKKTL